MTLTFEVLEITEGESDLIEEIVEVCFVSISVRIPAKMSSSSKLTVTGFFFGTALLNSFLIDPVELSPSLPLLALF